MKTITVVPEAQENKGMNPICRYRQNEQDNFKYIYQEEGKLTVKVRPCSKTENKSENIRSTGCTGKPTKPNPKQNPDQCEANTETVREQTSKDEGED